MTLDLHDYEFWPHVGRVDNVFGDRNPVCSCVGMENFAKLTAKHTNRTNAKRRTKMKAADVC